MRKRIVAGNWKMHFSVEESVALASAVTEGSTTDVLVAPVFTSLSAVSQALAGKNILLAAQNMYCEEKGAFTGEISSAMLKDVGCTHVIVGHSERRHVFGEDDVLVHKKVSAAREAGLIPILCVGETIEDRKAGNTNTIIEKQIKEGLAGLNGVGLGAIIIAYEPVWAIGTGEVATPEQAQEAHAFIRGLLKEVAGTDDIQILYGGSVKPENAEELIAQEDIDGFLIGGASLTAESFNAIIAICSK